MPTVNGNDLISAQLIERLHGNWIAEEVEVDTEEELDPSVTIEIDGVEWVGTAFRGQQDTGRYRCTVVGGAGGMRNEVPALYYDAGVKLELLIADILAIGGETLSPDSDREVLDRVLNRYHRGRGTVASALAKVISYAPGATYRHLRDGTVWIGADTFPELEVDSETVETDRFPSDGRVEIAPESPLVYPGVTYNGECVSEVTTYLNGHMLRQEYLCTSETAPTPTKEAQLTARIERGNDYARWYRAKVLGQSGGTVDVLPDDERIRGRGLTNIPMRLGLPGMTVELALGSYVMLAFEDADPTQPFVALWPYGSEAKSFTFSGDQTTTGEVTANTGAGPGVTLSQHSHNSPFGPLPAPTPGT